MSRIMAALPKIAEYWAANYEEALPDLLAGRDMDRPFCFKCGWRVPTTRVRPLSWRDAAGWLDRAHLHDHWNGGPGTPDNLVPLCYLCHRIMPEYHTSEDYPEALAWVRRDGHASCPLWWQQRTDKKWSGSSQFPGAIRFLEQYVLESRRVYLLDDAFRMAEEGDRDGAIARMLLVPGVSEADAAQVVHSFLKPALEVAA